MHNIEINTTTGKASFVSANVPAWHGLGDILPFDALTTEQCIKHGGFDYTVALNPLQTDINGVIVPIDNKFCTYRTDNNDVLGVVGNQYQIVQNTDAFAFFDAIVGKGQAIFQTAGVLGKGQRIFITAKMPNYIKIEGLSNDVTEMYIVLSSSHDGTGAIKAFITPVRVVCQNTLNYALRSAVNSVSIRHSGDTQLKLREAHKLLNIVNNYETVMTDTFNAMHKVKISDKVFNELLADLFPSTSKDGEKVSTRTENIRNGVTEAYFNGEGQSNILGTGWGAYNAITHYTNHNKNYTDLDNRFKSILEGNSYKLQQKAADKILSMA